MSGLRRGYITFVGSLVYQAIVLNREKQGKKRDDEIEVDDKANRPGRVFYLLKMLMIMVGYALLIVFMVGLLAGGKSSSATSPTSSGESVSAPSPPHD